MKRQKEGGKTPFDPQDQEGRDFRPEKQKGKFNVLCCVDCVCTVDVENVVRFSGL